MKKETIITAIVFLGVGFLAGYVFSARKAPRSATSVSLNAPNPEAAGAQNGSTGEEVSGLPQGHPPVTDNEIIQFFESASTRNPADPQPRLKLADFLYDRHRFREAISWYQQALQLEPKNADARTDLATCYFNLGDTRDALSELQEALRIDPHHAPTLFNLVVVNLEGAHDLTAARKAWEELHRINPGYPNLDQLKESLDKAAATPSASPVS